MPTSPLIFYLVLGSCLLLGVGLLVAAWRRPDLRRRGPRLLASAAVPVALWLAAYPPTRPVPLTRSAGILLTEGYQPDTLRQLQRQLGAGTPVWSYGVPPPAGAKPLSNLVALAERRRPLHQLHLVGRGVPAADLPTLGDVPIRAHAAAPFSGFGEAQWSPAIRLGQPLVVVGAATLPAGAAPAWVSLRAAGAGQDSVRLPAHGGAFRLHYVPKATGLLLPELVLRQAGRVVATEPVPVEVTPAVLPAVLLLAAVPSFEFKFLKNSLAAQGRAVALRSTVSRGLVQTEVVNQPAQSLDHLTPALLSRYPLVVADAATLAALPAAESQALRAAIQAGHLGLIALAEATALPAAVPGRPDSGVLSQPTTGAAAGPQLLAWPGAPAGARALLPARLRPSLALQPLITGPGAVLAAASRRVGLGTVVVATVAETFRWALAGQAAAYTSYWSQLLGAATPPPQPAATWQLASRWPRPHYPLALRLAASSLPAVRPTVRPLAGGPAVQLALAQDVRLPEWSTGQFWPRGAGWHQVRGPGSTSYQFFVYDSAAWRGPELAERQRALAKRIAVALPGGDDRGSARQPWAAGWFFGLFLLAAGFLWLEEKL